MTTVLQSDVWHGWICCIVTASL